MDVQTINLILIGFVLLFAFFGAFWGLIRGLKKTTFRGAWLIVTALILFFITPLLTRSMINVDLSGLNVEYNGVYLTTLGDFLSGLLASVDLGDILTQNPILWDLITILPTLLINTFLFVILFWFFKIVLWPLWAILAAVIFKKKDSAGNPKKRHRLLGMLVGVFCGLFISATTLMPILNTTNIMMQIERETANSSNNNQGIISRLAGDNEFISQLLADYDSFAIHYIYRFTGLEFLSRITYNGLSSTTINGERVTLGNEVKNAVIAASLIYDLANMDFDNLSKELIDEVLTISDRLIDAVFNITSVRLAGTDLLTYFLDGMTSGEDFIVSLPSTDNETLDHYIIEALRALETITFGDLRDDLKALVHSVRILNNAGVLQAVIDADSANLENIQHITVLATPAVVNEFVDTLMGMRLNAALVPLMFSAMVDLAAEALDVVGYDSELNDFSAENLKATFNNILNISVAIIGSLDSTFDFYVTRMTLIKSGQLLDTLRNIGGLAEANYMAFLTRAIDFADEQINELIDQNNGDLELPVSILNNIQNVLHNLKEITSFETEFTIIADAFDDVIMLIEAITDNRVLNYAGVGRILDAIQQTTLFGSEFISILENALDFVADNISTDLFDVADIIDTIKTNLNQSIIWEVEIPQFEALINFVQNSMANDVNFMEDIAILLPQLGDILDSLEDSQVIGNAIPQIIYGVFSSISDNLDAALPVAFAQVIDGIKQNILTAPTLPNWHGWNTELSYLTALAEIAVSDSAVTDEDILAALDIASGSMLLTRDVIVDMLSSIIDDMVGDGILDVPTAIIDQIKANLVHVTSFVNEWNYLNSFIDNFLDMLPSTGNYAGFEFYAIGQELDSLQNSVLLGNVRISIMNMILDEFANAIPSNNVTNNVNLEASIKANSNTFVTTNSASTTVFEDVFVALDDALALLSQLAGITVSNLNAIVVGTTLNDLSDNVVVGADTTAELAVAIIDNLGSGQPAAVVDALDNIKQDITSGNLPVNGYVGILENVETALSL